MPLLDSEARIAEAVPHESAEDSGVFAKRNHAHVLVIDDESLIVRSVTRTLTGHTVVAVTCARDALALFGAGDDFDLILCDLMMPDMDGIQLYRTVEREWPQLVTRFVFMTGGAYSDESRAFMETQQARQLEKPFSAEAIRSHVTRAIASR